MSLDVVHITMDEVLSVRLDVLRRGTPSTDATYAEDSDPSAVHLGIRIDGLPVATSSWYIKPFPINSTERALQLKGMAVRDNIQSTGAGKLLINAGLELARASECSLVWARARDSALYFYERAGFDTVGDAFIDDATGMSHHLVVRNV
jgi:GNAT superfamily N-acetyltransferase